jgi:Tannase and feruloyl esterase
MMKAMTFCKSLACALLLAATNLSGQTTKCGDLTKFHLPGFAMTIASAQEVPAAAPLPPYCRADGILDPRTGAEGKHYAIGFAVALPDNWNGRFLFQGGGALNGRIQDPYGKQSAGAVPALARGFAVVATDSGHQASPFDPSFFRDQEASLNFSYAAIGKVTVVAKALVAQYYGKSAHHSYFDGCSTGGREAMLVTQRYPDYFDGVIAASPAMRTGFSRIGDQWVTVAFNQIAPKNAAGQATGGAFSEADKKVIVDGLLNACDAQDGLRDGMIFNPQACKFDPSVLACSAAQAEAKPGSCLTSQQVGALKKAFAGPKDSRGTQVYPGFFYDTGISATTGIPGLLSWGASPFGPPVTSTAIDVDALAAAAGKDPRAAVTDTPWTNLSTFSGHRGKLIFYHGLSDPWFSALDTLGYYQRMAGENGGLDQVENWSRLFLVPGMGHCSGGKATLDSFDMLTALTDWVEKGTAPDSVVATGKAFPGRSRPLCAYPKHTQYIGQGDPENAANFKCSE